MKIYIASSNAHKISEFSRMFEVAGLNCQLLGANSLSGYVSPKEDGKTFEENAFIKAESLRVLAPNDAYVMADDSGIVVDALDGAPGIFSARYAGSDATDADKLNNKKLLNEMRNVPDCERSARFVCLIALITPQGEKIAFEGKFEGFIARDESGANGFGYDPLFYVPEFNCTSAELSPDKKNEVSHRAKAFQKLVKFLKENL